MNSRPFWINKINQLWEKRSIIWLSGVRRVGKTSICKMIPDHQYFNCDLPSVSRRLQDPEAFFNSINLDSVLIFDEVHQLENPSRLLKIAADEYPKVKIIATGSSTLEATEKFRDSLTGRKNNLYLSPILWSECDTAFNNSSFDHRLLFGGLPEPFLSSTKDEEFFSEWVDSYYARDIQELFSIRNRAGFLKLAEILLRQSGGQISYNELSKLAGVSLPTISSYLEALRTAHFVFFLRPFHSGATREILKQPKAYTFDTGFVTYARCWNEIRNEDRGILWEHLVLDMIRSEIPEKNIYYWKDKSNREIDFVIKRSAYDIDLIECKINPEQFSVDTIKMFRERYPGGKNYCLSPFIKNPYTQDIQDQKIEFCSLIAP